MRVRLSAITPGLLAAIVMSGELKLQNQMGMKKLIKRVILYITVLDYVVVLCWVHPCLTWLAFALVGIPLGVWCINNITLREFVRWSGYSTWYKLIK